MKKNLAFVSLAFLFFFGTTALAQERYVKPFDEGPKDASFSAFRTKLIAAAEKKDLKFIISVLDPEIVSSYGGHEGVKLFKEYWKLDQKDQKNSEFWEEFLIVMKNGGRFIGEGRNRMGFFAAPYLYNDMPNDLDMFEYHAIFGSNVNVREQPNMNAKVLTQFSYNIVKTDREATIHRKTGPGEWDIKEDWYKIESLGGVKGWVKAEYVRSPIDYRAGFEKKRGVWKMIFFVAGD